MKREVDIRRLHTTPYPRLLVCAGVIGASLVLAKAAKAADNVAPPAAVGAGSLLQFGLGLAIVLGLIVAAGWFMKRFSIGPAAAGTLKVVAGTAVGQRERVVVVEIGETWMVLGVAPGRVNALHTMPRGQVTTTTQAQPAATPAAFAAWLKEKMEKRDAR
ncbi:MAG: putative flagellar protein FliO [Betaproteobacteria bacterium]|nr:putative flagellar protein FliO [Betaproteobacteria bacterium]